ncbi:MAG: nitrite/sulfite reductase [Candidatus Bathyarchaeota archaeon]|nr:MAG: nitrite/sulfite reductase [Candidatus Bathyarchaeota archaeon]
MQLNTDDINRFIGRFSLGRDSNPLNVTGSPHFLRIKIPGGLLDTKQFRRIAELARGYSRGQAEITNRQDIQLHWIDAKDALDIFSIMDEMGFTTDMCGQGFSGARYGDARNIVCCPVSGIDRNELLNGAALLKKLSDFFIGNPDFQDMPRKFKFSISGCGCDCTRAVINDLAFVAVKKNEEIGYTLLAGGGIGASLPGPQLAKPIYVFIKPEDAFTTAVAIIEIHRDYSSRESKSKARFKWLLHTWGLKKFLNTLEEKVGKRPEKYEGAAFIKNGEHEGVQSQKQKGYDYINVPLIGGTFTSDEMISLANLADEYGNGKLRLTPTQNLIIPYVEKKDTLLRRLEENGFQMRGSKLRWTSMGCASDFCGKTKTPHAKDLTKKIVDGLEKQFNIKWLNEAEFRIYISGCPNNCCANLIAEIGLAGKLAKVNGDPKQTYTLLLGGGFGTKLSLGRRVEVDVPAEKISSRIKSLLMNYFKEKEASETLREFCNRCTQEDLKHFLTLPGD